jgi:dihydrofolate reductase
VKLHDRYFQRMRPGFLQLDELTAWIRGDAKLIVNDSIERVLEQAHANCGGKDIRIAGCANLIQQYLAAGLVDELEIMLAPVIFGGGRRLFETIPDSVPGFKIDTVMHDPLATFLRYVCA